MKVLKTNGWVWIGLTLITLSGCSRRPEGWTPILEQTSTSFLRTETQRVLTEVRQARSAIASEPETALDSLTRAEHGLDHLLRYYLPLLDARERAYNAYRHFYLGETDQTMRELEEVEALLLGVSELDNGRLLDEMQDPLEKIEDARAALRVGSDQAAADLEALATTLNFLVLKGELVLARAGT